MKVLITGASGRVGSMLARHLQANGHQVRGFDLVEPSPNTLDEMIVGDLLHTKVLNRALDGVDGVAHLAAFMSWHPKDVTKLFEINVTGTYNLLQAARGCNLQRFVFASSGEVYPELNPAYLPIDEAHPTYPTSPYGMTKLLGEKMVKNFGEQIGLPFCILRFAHTQAAPELLDPDSFFSGPRFFVNAKIRQLRSFPPSPAIEKSVAALQQVATEQEQLFIACNPDGQPYRMAICDARDMIQGVTLALTHDNAVGETFNIGPVTSFDFDEAVNYMASVTGLPVHKVHLHTTSYRYDASIDKAMRLLGYSPQYDIFRMIDDAVSTQVGEGAYAERISC